MVLYLDFDGVLHPFGEEAIDEYGRLLPNPQLFCWLPILSELLSPYPAVRVIVSSDWRRLFSDQELMRLLGELGGRFVGVVENINRNRAQEIACDANSRVISDWLALDDHATVHAAALAGDTRYIPCQPHLGLSDRSVQGLLGTRLLQSLTQAQREANG